MKFGFAVHILILPLVFQIITVNFFIISTFLFTQLIHTTDVRARLGNKITVSHCIVYDNSPQKLTPQFAWNKYGWNYILNKKMYHAKHYMVIRAHLGRYDKAEG